MTTELPIDDTTPLRMYKTWRCSVYFDNSENRIIDIGFAEPLPWPPTFESVQEAEAIIRLHTGQETLRIMSMMPLPPPVKATPDVKKT